MVGGQGKRVRRRVVQAKEKGKLVPEAGVKTSKGFKKKKVPIHAMEKDKNGRAMAVTISTSELFQDSITKRALKKAPSKRKRNQEVTVLLVKKTKEDKKSILDSKKKAITNSFQAQSILGQQSKAGVSTLVDNTYVTCKSNSSSRLKHSTFSGVSDILGWTAPAHEDNTEQPRSVQTTQRPSHGHDHGSTDEPQMVYQRADPKSGVVEEDTSSFSVNAGSTGICCTPLLTTPKERTVLGNSVDLNRCREISNSSNCLNSISLACLSGKMPARVVSHLDDDRGLNLDAEYLGEEKHMIPQGSSLAGKSLSQPSNSCLSDRSKNTLQDRLDANCHIGNIHPIPLSSGKDVMSSITSSTGSNKSADTRASDCVSASRNKYFSNDYVGLPLNSRGELVKLHPGGTPNSNNILKSYSCGSAAPTFIARKTCTGHVSLRPDHHVPQICTVDQSISHLDPHFSSTAPTTYEMDFRKLPGAELKTQYTNPSNKYQCTNQLELTLECCCSRCIKCHNPQQEPHGMQRCLLSRNCEDTQPTVETTMRLMGKIVALGNSDVQCRALNNETLCSSKQSRAEHYSFHPQLFHGGLVGSTSAFRILDGQRQPSENTSYFSFVPAAEPRSGLDTSSLRTNGYNQQPKQASANNQYVQQVSWCNEGELGHQQTIIANQVQSNAKGMMLNSMHCRQTQSVATVPSFTSRNRVGNFVGKRPAPYQSSYLTPQCSNMAQVTQVSSPLSGYAAQSNPGLTTQTKFTSLPPLPPSVIPSPVYGVDCAQPHESTTTTFHPPIRMPYPASKCKPPDNAIFKDESLRWTMMGSKPDGLEHMKRNCKGASEEDAVFLTLPPGPCTALQKDLNSLPLPEKGLQFCGSKRVAQPQGLAIIFGNEPRPDLRLGNKESHATLSDPINSVRSVNGFGSEPGPGLWLGNKESHTTWSGPANMARPVKLKSGAKPTLQPTDSSTGQGNYWLGHSVTPLAAGNDACTVSTSKKRDRDTYKF